MLRNLYRDLRTKNNLLLSYERFKHSFLETTRNRSIDPKAGCCQLFKCSCELPIFNFPLRFAKKLMSGYELSKGLWQIPILTNREGRMLSTKVIPGWGWQRTTANKRGVSWKVAPPVRTVLGSGSGTCFRDQLWREDRAGILNPQGPRWIRPARWQVPTHVGISTMAGDLGFYSHLRVSCSKAWWAWTGPANWWMSLEDNHVGDLAILLRGEFLKISICVSLFWGYSIFSEISCG